MDNIDNTLNERKGQHGEFADNAKITCKLVTALRLGPSHAKLTPTQKIALHFIMHKAARIVSGDPCHIDHWHDIGGYAKLVEKELTPVEVTATEIRVCPECRQDLP